MRDSGSVPPPPWSSDPVFGTTAIASLVRVAKRPSSGWKSRCLSCCERYTKKDADSDMLARIRRRHGSRRGNIDGKNRSASYEAMRNRAIEPQAEGQSQKVGQCQKGIPVCSKVGETLGPHLQSPSSERRSSPEKPPISISPRVRSDRNMDPRLGDAIKHDG